MSVPEIGKMRILSVNEDFRHLANLTDTRWAVRQMLCNMSIGTSRAFQSFSQKTDLFNAFTLMLL